MRPPAAPGGADPTPEWLDAGHRAGRSRQPRRRAGNPPEQACPRTGRRLALRTKRRRQQARDRLPQAPASAKEQRGVPASFHATERRGGPRVNRWWRRQQMSAHRGSAAHSAYWRRVPSGCGAGGSCANRGKRTLHNPPHVAESRAMLRGTPCDPDGARRTSETASKLAEPAFDGSAGRHHPPQFRALRASDGELPAPLDLHPPA
jgi:hypothetical protein